MIIDSRDKLSGDKKASIFSVNELPAWSEIQEWYDNYAILDGSSYRDVSAEVDHYWKIPRKNLLSALVCNQFNKMVIEDGFKDDLITYLNSIYSKDTIKDVRFWCHLPIEDAILYEIDWEIEIVHCIYSAKNPSGKPDIFARLDYPHECINDITSDIDVYPVMLLDTGHTVVQKPSVESVYSKIIDWMMTPYKEYFGGDSPGWKYGGSNTVPPVVHMGYDPAL